MYQLQEFHQAFDVAFPVEIADQVLAKMERLFGSDFNRKYGHLSTDELRNEMCSVLHGVTPFQLAKALQRLSHAEKMPLISAFGAWCEDADEFWSADAAWAKATAFLNDNRLEITTLVKQALDDVSLILSNEGQKSAGFAFRDIYKKLVLQAKEHGEHQQIWDRHQQKEINLVDELALVERAMKPIHQQVVSRQQELIKSGMQRKQARIQAQKELYQSKAQPINKMVGVEKGVSEQPEAAKPEPVLTPMQQLIKEGRTPAEAFRMMKERGAA